MIQELRICAIRVRNVVRGRSALSRLCRVRVLFPDIGSAPVLFELAFERFSPDESVRIFPSPPEVFEHLRGLTTP